MGSLISFEDANIFNVKINEKFVGERGRINCSLRASEGFGVGWVFSS